LRADKRRRLKTKEKKRPEKKADDFVPKEDLDTIAILPAMPPPPFVTGNN